MRSWPLFLAGALVIAMAADVAAKPKGMAMGRGMDFAVGRGFGPSAGAVRPWQNENHPAYWAPGHVKKRNGAISARLYAPRRANRATYLRPGQRFR